jgi:hypothetical protein
VVCVSLLIMVWSIRGKRSPLIELWRSTCRGILGVPVTNVVVCPGGGRVLVQNSRLGSGAAMDEKRGHSGHSNGPTVGRFFSVKH